MPKRYPSRVPTGCVCPSRGRREGGFAVQRARRFRGHALPVEAPSADRRGSAQGMKSFEADELAQALRTIAELEAELEITRAAVALFNGEEAVRPKGGARSPKD